MAKTAKAPDYAAAAEKTAESSKEVTNMQTWANRPDQVTPYGSTTWAPEDVVDPATGQHVTKWTQTTTLTPESQKALEDQFAVTSGRSDIARDLLPRAQQEYSQQMDWSQFQDLADTPQAQAFSQMPTASSYSPEDIQRSIQTNTYNPVNFQQSLDTSGLQNVDPSQRYYSEAGDALMQQFDARNNPQNERDTAALDTTLRNRGLKPGDVAYDRELQKLRQSQSDARTNASFQASQLAGQEAQRMYGMDSATRAQQFGEVQSQGNFANQAAQSELAQQLGIGQQRFAEAQGAGTFANSAAAQDLAQQLGIGKEQFDELMQITGLADTRQKTQYAQDTASAQYQNTLRQQQIAEEMQKRGFSLNEINALISGQQVGLPTMPSFNTAQRSDAVDYSGAARDQYAAAQAAADSQNAMTNGLIQAGASMVS